MMMEEIFAKMQHLRILGPHAHRIDENKAQLLSCTKTVFEFSRASTLFSSYDICAGRRVS